MEPGTLQEIKRSSPETGFAFALFFLNFIRF
jgi:hypothetical protein